MTLTDFLKETDLEQTLLVGYYGGGNYGDELLLEVMQHLLHQKGVEKLTITYQRPSKFLTMHHNLGYEVIDIRSKTAIPLHTLKNKNIIIGGGALWGVDMNLNTLLLSMALLVSRWLFGKRVYLIGIGYHNSTSRMGRIGAWCAGKAARMVLARDDETYANFSKITASTVLDKDIAWYVNNEMLNHYENDVKQLSEHIKIRKKTIFICLRRTQAGKQARGFEHYNKCVEIIIKNNPSHPIIVAPLELATVSKAEYIIARQWQKKYKNVTVLEMPYNPLTLLLLFKKFKKELLLIGPQFHIILTAKIANVPFFPVVYDNKVHELLKQMGINTQVPLAKLQPIALQAFIDKEFGKP